MRFNWPGGPSKLTSPSDTATGATATCFITSLRIRGGMQIREGRLEREEEEEEEEEEEQEREEQEKEAAGAFPPPATAISTPRILGLALDRFHRTSGGRCR
jgi:hypothetical protein